MTNLIGISPNIDESIRLEISNGLSLMNESCQIFTKCPCDFNVVIDKNRSVLLKYAYITNDSKLAVDFFLSNDIIDVNGKTVENIIKEVKWILDGYGKDKKMTDNVWFTSDSHFYHGNIIKYCNRPWNSGNDEKGEIIVTEKDIENMNNAMIDNWNSTVGKNDIVWHLGDFCLGKNQQEHIPNLVSKLNGRINIILGNHDHNKLEKYYEWGFHRVYDRNVIINNYVVLSHSPMEFIGPNSCFYNIFGHVHNSENYQTFTKNSCCVCVERWDYKPVSWGTIQEKYNEMNG